MMSRNQQQVFQRDRDSADDGHIVVQSRARELASSLWPPPIAAARTRPDEVNRSEAGVHSFVVRHHEVTGLLRETTLPSQA